MEDIINVVSEELLNPLILLMFAVATLSFLWGLFKYVKGAYSDQDQDQGKSNIIWGIVGMVIMISVYGIINLIKTTIAGQ